MKKTNRQILNSLEKARKSCLEQDTERERLLDSINMNDAPEKKDKFYKERLKENLVNLSKMQKLLEPEDFLKIVCQYIAYKEYLINDIEMFLDEQSKQINDALTAKEQFYLDHKRAEKCFHESLD